MAEDSIDEDVTEIDMNFLSDPYAFDPVLLEGAPVNFDVQGSIGTVP